MNLYRRTRELTAFTDALERGLAVAAFVFLAAASITLARTPPASAYELSVYDAYPLYFWVLISASIFCGILALIYAAFAPVNKKHWWSLAAIAAIFANVLILALPAARGYVLNNRADEVTHFGAIKDIVTTGHYSGSDVYPLSHVLGSQLSVVSGLDPASVMMLLIVLFYLLYVSGLYLLAKETGAKTKQALVVLALGSVLLFSYFNVFFIPSQLFLFLIPIFILFLFKQTASRKGHAETIVILLFAFTLPFLHPMGALFAVIILVLFDVSLHVHRVLNKGGQTPPLRYSPVILPAIVLFIVFFMWFSNFARFQSSINTAYERFVGGQGDVPIGGLTTALGKADLGFFGSLDVIFRTYGPQLIFIGLSVAALFIIARKLLSHRIPLRLEEVFFPLVFVLFVILYAVQQFTGIISGIGSSTRILCWALFGGTMLSGIVLYERISRIQRSRRKSFVSLLLVFVIVVSGLVGIFNTYNSPFDKQAGNELMRADVSSEVWFLGRENASAKVLFYDEFPVRAAAFVYGYDASLQKEGHYWPIPTNFDYNEIARYSETVDQYYYMIFNKRIWDYKTELWPNTGTFTLNDMRRVDSDPTVLKIYTNGGADMYYVQAPSG